MRRDEPWLLYRSEASGCSDGEAAGENPGGLGERHPLPTRAPETAVGRQCVQQGDLTERCPRQAAQPCVCFLRDSGKT